MDPVTLALAVAPLVAKAAEHFGDALLKNVSGDLTDRAAKATGEAGWSLLGQMAVRIRQWFVGKNDESGTGAVDRVIRRSHEPTCLEVVRALCEGDATEAQVGGALEVYARTGLTQLGFANPAVRLRPVGQRQVTYLPIRDLPGPAPSTPRAEYSQAERMAKPRSQVPSLTTPAYLEHLGALYRGDYLAAQKHAEAKLIDLRT